MDLGFLLAQIFGGVALVFVCISYFVKSRQNFLLLNIVANIFYGAAFISQGLLVAGVNTFLSMARTVGLYIIVKTNQKPRTEYFLLNLVVYFISTSLFFSSPADLVVLATSVIFTIAYFSSSLRVTRAMSILPNIMLTIYSLCFGIYTNALLSAIETCVVTAAVIKFEVMLRREKNLKAKR